MGSLADKSRLSALRASIAAIEKRPLAGGRIWRAGGGVRASARHRARPGCRKSLPMNGAMAGPRWASPWRRRAA